MILRENKMLICCVDSWATWLWAVCHSSGDLFQCICYWTYSLGLAESWNVELSNRRASHGTVGYVDCGIGRRSGNPSPASTEEWLYISHLKKERKKNSHFEISLDWQKSGKIKFVYAFYIFRGYGIIHWEVSISAILLSKWQSLFGFCQVSHLHSFYVLGSSLRSHLTFIWNVSLISSNLCQFLNFFLTFCDLDTPERELIIL